MSFWNDLTGKTASEASNAAAQDTYAKQRAATGAYRQYGDQYANSYRDLSKGYDSYVNAGNGALGRLLSGLNLPGGTGSQADFTNSYRNTPGYQSALETGTNSALRGINASGMSNSGAALKALARYGQGFEDQQSGNYLNRLSGLAGQGMQATGAQIGTVGQGLEGQRAIEGGAFQGDYGAANTIGEGMVAGAQAKQQGTQNLFNTGAKLIGSFAGGGFGSGGGGSYLGNLMKGNGFMGQGNSWYK